MACVLDTSASLPPVKLNPGHWINISIITYTHSRSRDTMQEWTRVFIAKFILLCICQCLWRGIKCVWECC